jgi:hypothetical protein
MTSLPMLFWLKGLLALQSNRLISFDESVPPFSCFHQSLP